MMIFYWCVLAYLAGLTLDRFIVVLFSAHDREVADKVDRAMLYTLMALTVAWGLWMRFGLMGVGVSR
jgi:hypothetical protein